MDLAKIRKKSQQTLESRGDMPITPTVPQHEVAQGTLEIAPEASLFTQEEPVEKDFFSAPVSSILSAVTPITALSQEFVGGTHTPLEAILAGRTAAGCDDESLLADDISTEIISDSCLEFLCFRVSDEIYGINIMDIKEIIKPREVTEVPRAPLFVTGVLSLRGTIIPVIDMRIRLGLHMGDPNGKERIVVIKNNNTFSGLLVDEVIQVVQVQQDSVEAAPIVLDGIDRDFVNGIGRSENSLIIILNLENITDINLY